MAMPIWKFDTIRKPIYYYCVEKIRDVFLDNVQIRVALFNRCRIIHISDLLIVILVSRLNVIKVESVVFSL